MVRPPRSHDRVLKKGPWTPDEDITLVSYINQHGPTNWPNVSTNSGLLRCSKSCRMRWINYLRPGIKRGNFSEEEERMIINLQARLGNRWSAIATYLPQRTDNDIKNYWNTHLKKKINNNSSSTNQGNVKESGDGYDNNQIGNWESITRASLPGKSLWARRLQTDIHMVPPPTTTSLSNVLLTNNEGLMVQDSVTKTNVNYQQPNWMCPFYCRKKWLPRDEVMKTIPSLGETSQQHECMEDIN